MEVLITLYCTVGGHQIHNTNISPHLSRTMDNGGQWRGDGVTTVIVFIVYQYCKIPRYFFTHTNKTIWCSV